MNGMLVDARAVLDQAQYGTFSLGPDRPFFFFEDQSVMGFVHSFETVAALLSSWEQVQDSFLSDHAVQFIEDAAKAWNIYSVFLTAQPASGDATAKLSAVEEDFRGTRKIARAGVASRDDLLTVLAPLLPLRHHLSVGTADLNQAIGEQVAGIDGALRALPAAEPEAIAASMVGPEE